MQLSKYLTARRINNIARILDETYPKTNLYNRSNPLEEAIFILLTSQTDEKKYLKTWNNFRYRFPTISSVDSARANEIYHFIKVGGLGRWKAKRIKNLIQYTKKQYGRYSLSSLNKLNDDDLEKELLKLDGIGIKSARCIMMYSFGRVVFPIDTHALRVLKRLGLHIAKYSKRSKRLADQIQNQIPERIRYRLHVNLIQHGRQICTKNPKCPICIARRFCNYFKYSFFK